MTKSYKLKIQIGNWKFLKFNKIKKIADGTQPNQTNNCVNGCVKTNQIYPQHVSY